MARACAMAVVLPLGRDILRIIYPAQYAEGAATLGWLLAGSSALSLAEASLTMLSGAGGPRNSVFVLSLAVLIQIGLGLFLIPRYHALGAAQSTLIAALVALAVAVTLLRRLVGTALRGRLLATSIMPMAVVGGVSWLWGRLAMPPFVTLFFIALTYLLYLGGVYGLNRASLRRLLSGGQGGALATGDD